MLNSEDMDRIASIMDVLNTGDVTSLSSEAIKWMADTLKELNKELEEALKEIEHNKPIFVGKQQYPNPLMLNGRVVAILKDVRYECVFCDVIHISVESATGHAQTHLKRMMENEMQR